MEANSQLCDSALYNQLEEAYGKVIYSYTTQVIHAGRLYKRYKALKWGQLILSAVSTGGFIGTLISNQIILTWIGGVCSTILLVLTAYFKDVDLSAIYNRHLETSNQLWLLREQYLSLLTDFSTLSRAEIVGKRDDLQTRVAKVYNEAPLTDAKSYSLAQKALKENESQFFSRQELNQMLPESLRKEVGSKQQDPSLWQRYGNKKSDSVCFTDNTNNVDTLC